MDYINRSNLLVPVVGNYYRSQPEKQFFNQLRAGATLVLRFDPNNKFDKRAVKVMSHCNKHLGWLAKEDAAKLHNLIDQADDDDDYQSNRFTSVGFNRTQISFIATVVSAPKSSYDRMMLKVKECNVDFAYDSQDIVDPRTYEMTRKYYLVRDTDGMIDDIDDYSDRDDVIDF